jgi:hypothetical protein
MRTLFIAAVSFLLALSQFTFAQKPEQCLALLKEHNRKMAQIAFPADGQVYYFESEQQIDMWDSISEPSVKMNVKIIMSSNQIQYYTNDIELYQDERDAFMVVKPKKMIAWSTSSLNELKGERFKELTKTQDTLLAVSTVTSCRTVKDGEKSTTIMVLTPKADAQRAFKVKTATYWFNNVTKRVEEVVIEFMPGYDAKRRTTSYKTMDLNYKLIKLNKPVLGLVLDKKNKPLSKYKGFQLIDNR